MKPRFGRRWRGSEAGRHEGGKLLAGTSRKGKPTSGLEPLTSSHYACTRFCGAGSSISARPAPRILSAYVLCFILLDSRHYQLERWCVMRCNECLAVSSAPIPCEVLASLYVLPRNLVNKVPTSGLEPLIPAPATSLLARILARPTASGNCAYLGRFRLSGGVGLSIVY